MRSTQTLEPGRHAGERVSELLVLRQHPITRTIIPYGRLANTEEGFEFAYTRAAEAVGDLSPLPGFDDLHRRYVSPSLPVIFAQRVMSSERPDFAAYVHSLGLDPGSATPWEQIVQSGGHREGDTLQLMELPAVRDGRAQARFFVNGVRHIPDGEVRSIGGRQYCVTAEEHDRAFEALRPGMLLQAIAQDHNTHDPDAMIVVSLGDVPLGWVPQALSSSLRELSSEGPVPLSVVRVGLSTGPAHQRLVVELNAPVAYDFAFDREGRWEPLS